MARYYYKLEFKRDVLEALHQASQHQVTLDINVPRRNVRYWLASKAAILGLEGSHRRKSLTRGGKETIPFSAHLLSLYSASKSFEETVCDSLLHLMRRFATRHGFSLRVMTPSLRYVRFLSVDFCNCELCSSIRCSYNRTKTGSQPSNTFAFSILLADSKRHMELCDDSAGAARIGECGNVRVIVRPLADDDAAYVDVRIGAGVTFDVILHFGDGDEDDARFVHIQRCLHDFVQLEHNLHREHSGNENDLETLPTVVESIKAYVAQKKKQREQQQRSEANKSLLYPAHLVEPRFAWQLETYLASLITHKSANVRVSQALQRFLHGDIADRVTLGGDVAQERHRERYVHLVETLLATDGAHANDVDDERIASGCSVEHTVLIQCVDAEDGDEASTYLVLWKFASRGDRVMFAARFVQENAPLRSADEADTADPYSAVDPYQSTVNAWGESISSRHDSNEDDDDEVVLSIQDGPLSQFMVQYRTQYAFSGDEAATPQEFVYGHFVATSPGALSLEWSNEDSSSVLSKPLAFHVHVVPLAQAGDTGKELIEAFDRKRGAQGQDGGEDESSWVPRLIVRSTMKSLDDVVFASSDEQMSMPVVDNSMHHHQSSFTNETDTQMQRLREEKHFHEQRAAELEERVSHLEEALHEAKKELKKAQDDIEISGEIYKASLETIAQLEMHKPVASLSTQEEKAESVIMADIGDCPRGPNGAFDAKEYQRVVDLCTTFQEQCLWRSIEVTESEKRNLSLDAKLAQVTRENAELVAQVEARNALVIDLRTQNQTLKAHKSLLVQEVKKLQPFSQINVAALVQDAQEARMMQRSLQAQLNAASMRTDPASPSPVPAKTTLDGEEESEPGFVVIGSKDHSNDDEDDGMAMKNA